MRIAIIGTRGIPANYGGFETFAEELSTRLVERGHEVTVYCRSHYAEGGKSEHGGVRLVVLPTIKRKYLDTVVHSFLSAVHAMRRFDAVLICNAANAPFIPILTWTGTSVAINVDGLERMRKKWSWLGSLYYRLGERCSVWFATELISDARVIHDYYLSEYGAASTMIAYGAEVKRELDAGSVAVFGLEPNGYILYLSRLEPENNAAMVIEAFRKVETDLKLVIVGDAPYANEYKKLLGELADGDERIVFTGAVFGERRKAIQQNSYAYVHATEVGGTHPALIEAMGYGNCVLTYATAENHEVVDSSALIYADADDLAEKLRTIIADKDLVSRLAASAQSHVAKHYNWNDVTDRYEDLFRKMAARR